MALLFSWMTAQSLSRHPLRLTTTAGGQVSSQAGRLPNHLARPSLRPSLVKSPTTCAILDFHRRPALMAFEGQCF